MTIISQRQRSKFPVALQKAFWGPVAFSAAFGPLVFVHLCQYPSLILLPFSRRLFNSYNRVMAFIVWGWWAYSIRRLVGVQVNITGDPLPLEENAIVISNHQTMGDIPVLLCLAMEHKRVADLKWLVKDELKYLPGIGIGLKFLDSVFLKRRWADDAERIAKTFRRYLELGTPMWLVLFPEGTRATDQKLSGSTLQVPGDAASKRHLLAPRPKGFAASVQGLRSFVSAVYDVTVIYSQHQSPSLIEVMRGDIAEVQVRVRRFPIQDMPHSTEELSLWLRDRFAENHQFIGKTLQEIGR